MNLPTFDINKVNTPCYVTEECYLKHNGEILKSVQERTGCKILLAQKAFSMYSSYPLLQNYLAGTTASGVYEARLGYEHFGKETHVYSPAYTKKDMDELLKYAGHFVFNSIRQFVLHKDKMAGKECGIRVNPRFSTQEGHEIYDPCAKNSRLGQTLSSFEEDVEKYGLDGVSGIHFHTLCEQNSDDLYKTAMVVEEQFGKYLSKMKWINFGGGHHITREDYDIETLVRVIEHFKNKYNLQVYLEPGEAVALNAGFLVSEVIDIIDGKVNGERDIAIMDVSAACHMPDVLEMPYRPKILDSRNVLAGEEGEKAYIYRLGTPTCLAGDIIGDYSFDSPLKVGDRLVFCDMAIYSTVKNNTFNGMPLPTIYYNTDDELKVIRKFSYEDFKSRI
ncbi:MAG: carboxynorspermidine decarboxylase [Ruminococcaceae bacterium]|nr:carboxynorspermidine decarboxylase [Oscillospiraceae bacterium]